MATLRSASTTTPTMLPSGISSIPKVLEYPSFFDYEYINRLEHIYCYIQDHPINVDLTVLIYRDVKEGDVYTLCSDNKANLIELSTDQTAVGEAARKFVQDHVADFVRLMNVTKIEQAQFHFSVQKEELILVDIRTAINKYASPGLLEDVFGKFVKTLKTRTMVILTPSVIEAIIQGMGPYSGDLLIKPSRFRIMDDQPDFRPLSVEIKR